VRRLKIAFDGEIVDEQRSSFASRRAAAVADTDGRLSGNGTAMTTLLQVSDPHFGTERPPVVAGCNWQGAGARPGRAFWRHHATRAS
jgi:hypothetical protein